LSTEESCKKATDKLAGVADEEHDQQSKEELEERLMKREVETKTRDSEVERKEINLNKLR
jgi:hypothetical protein